MSDVHPERAALLAIPDGVLWRYFRDAAVASYGAQRTREALAREAANNLWSDVRLGIRANDTMREDVAALRAALTFS
jgi:hypothetical protein